MKKTATKKPSRKRVFGKWTEAELDEVFKVMQLRKDDRGKDQVAWLDASEEYRAALARVTPDQVVEAQDMIGRQVCRAATKWVGGQIKGAFVRISAHHPVWGRMELDVRVVDGASSALACVLHRGRGQ